VPAFDNGVHHILEEFEALLVTHGEANPEMRSQNTRLNCVREGVALGRFFVFVLLPVGVC